MSILLWILFGGIVGWIASMIMKTNSSQGMIMDIILGIVGAVIGGLIMNAFGEPGVTGFNLYSVLVAVLGAIVVIWIGSFLTGMRRSP
jgi:uncharacterized membrane protein YeaQ/YmgE (transglycosylase-associated protein family)